MTADTAVLLVVFMVSVFLSAGGWVLFDVRRGGRGDGWVLRARLHLLAPLHVRDEGAGGMAHLDLPECRQRWDLEHYHTEDGRYLGCSWILGTP